MRRLRKLRWSFLRRVAPLRQRIIPFDLDLRIEVRSIDRLGRRIYLDGYSDPELAVFLDAFLRPGMTYFDVGAHFGQFTLMAAKRVGPSGSVHAFEPTSETYAQLARNVELNGFDAVCVNHAAVFDAPGEMELNLCETGKGEFNSLGAPQRPADEVHGVEVVPTVALDGYCEARGVAGIDLMKIDVEGAERKAVRGGRRTLGGDDAPVLLVEFNESTCRSMGYTTLELRRDLEELGYGFFRFDPATREVISEPEHEEYAETLNLVGAKDPDFLRSLLQGDAPG